MWPFKKKKSDITIYNYVIMHDEDKVPEIAYQIQKKLNAFCDAVIAYNELKKSNYMKLVQGSVVYSQENNTVKLFITGGLRPVVWVGDVVKFLDAKTTNIDVNSLLSGDK